MDFHMKSGSHALPDIIATARDLFVSSYFGGMNYLVLLRLD